MNPTKKLLATVVFLGLSLPVGVGAQSARMPCHKASEVARQLNDKYGEVPVAFGMQSNGNLLQVYYSEADDTWTVVTTTPDGMSCIVASGEHWERIPLTDTDPLA